MREQETGCRDMKKKRIPGTDLDSSVILFGGGAISLTDREAFAFQLMDLYADQGGNHLDTGNVYGKWLPEATNISEQYIGRWMKTRGCRNQMIVASKGGHPDLASMHIPRLSRLEVRQDLDESLAALQTDRIDLYWLHRDDVNRPVEEIIGYLDDFLREGKIRWYGCSNWKLPRLEAAIAAAKKSGSRGFAANQLPWSLAETNREGLADTSLATMDQATWTLHRREQLAAMAYSSQAGGYFQKLLKVGKQGIRTGLLRQYDLPLNDRRFALLVQMSAEQGCTVDELVLGFLLAQPFPVFPIIGASSPEQLMASLSAGGRDWDPSLAQRLQNDV